MQEKDIAVNLTNTVQIERPKDLLGALADLGGLLIFFYVLFFAFTTCCTRNHFENYLFSEIFTA